MCSTMYSSCSRKPPRCRQSRALCIADYCLMAQESRVVRVIKKQLVKRSLDLLKEVASRPAKDGKNDYETFWDAFGKFIKLGAIEDQTNK